MIRTQADPNKMKNNNHPIKCELPLEDRIEIQFEKGVRALSENETLQNALEVYFRPKSFEKSGKLYKALGVRQFKKFVPSCGDYFNRLVKKFVPDFKNIYDESSARRWEFMTRAFEGMHTLLGLGTALLTASELSNRDYKEIAIMTGINILGNVYPIMTQRYNRARIYNFLEGVEEKKLRDHNKLKSNPRL